MLAVTFFSALFLELEFAIFASVLLSYLDRTSKPRIVTLTPDLRQPDRLLSSEPNHPQCPQLRIIRVDGSLFFGSVNHVEQTFDRLCADTPEQRHLAVVASGINFIDLQGGTTFAQEAKRRKAAGGGLYLINVKEGYGSPWALRLHGCGGREKCLPIRGCRHPRHLSKARPVDLRDLRTAHIH